jgi:hypothetical protein
MTANAAQDKRRRVDTLRRGHPECASLHASSDEWLQYTKYGISIFI